MKITNLNYSENENRARISAKIIWEDSDRESQEIYFETEKEFSNDIVPNPHSFLVASIVPALYFGESRVHIDETICPSLKEGLNTAMSLLHQWWYPPTHKLVSIEAKKLKSHVLDGKPKRAAFCFSGGVDSLATLFNNRIEYPKSHPEYLKDGLVVFGLEVRNIETFQKVLGSISTLAKDSNLTFIPVYTNIIQLGPENTKEFWEKFWLNEYMSASFSSIAHAFSKRWGSFAINSSHDIPNLIPHGSNPLLTSCYSSWDLRIKEEGIRFSRFKKTELISKWDTALQHLRVCNVTESYQHGILNCGECEKCVRTMLALTVLGALEKATAFPVNDVTSELVESAVQLRENTLLLYDELLGPLEKAGRHNLVAAIRRKIAEFRERRRKEKLRKRMIQPIVDFDRKYLKGNMRRLKQAILLP